ncbi:hypothetical protein FS749_015436 [Ceratobasidium sp. UAMH 11750]|nr:hypothetical protein FS749_015436 [Ceratobasidium sp. UAMH 11750]
MSGHGEVQKLSKGQRKRRNKAARAAAAAAAAGGPASQSNRSAHALFPRSSPFSKLPAGIFAQIVPRLYPEDVIHLAQVNKSIRKVLMSRSAAPMWRACIGNNGLPACPPELSEPGYVSLLFQGICSSCGGTHSDLPDAWLFVRLCQRCGEKLLVEWETIEPTEVKQLVLTTDVRVGFWRYSKKCLKRDVDSVKSRLLELQSSDDKDALQVWVRTRNAELQRRQENGQLLARSLEVVRNNRSDELKRGWRERAEHALTALGHSLPKEEDLPIEKRHKWRALMEQSSTESNWNKHQSRIIQFIKNEEKDRPVREQKERRAARDIKLRELYDSLRHTTNLLPDDKAELPVMQAIDLMVEWLPLPRYDDVLEWPTIRDLVEIDVAAEEVTGRFEKHRGEIVELIADWGKKVKRELANVLRAGMKEQGLAVDPLRPRLLASEADTNPFDHLDGDTCLLFRADTFFNYKRQYRKDSLQSYDSLVGSLRLGKRLHEPQNKDKFELTAYTWSSEARTTARVLLLAMGYPEDAASIEFSESNNKWFACGRCNDLPMSWSSLVAHYIERAGNWKYVQTKLPELAEAKIVYNNIHDPGFNEKPLAKRLSAEEVEALEAKHLENDQEKDEYEDDYRFACRLCMNTEIGSPMSTDIEEMFPHLIDVHEISDPQDGIDGEGFGSVEDSPYICVLEQVGGWGWCLVDG